jgi:NADH-quinone oxidoreductase subunit C
MTHTKNTLTALKNQFGETLGPVDEFRGETSVWAPRQAIVDVLRFLKEAQGYLILAELTAYDDWPVEPRFTVSYVVRELSTPSNLRVRVRVPGDDPVLPSVTPVYLNANWYERELYDMFGLRLTGHPDLRRILMPADWVGHPLRKDYPLGYEEVQFTFNFDEIEKKKPYARE